MAEKETKTVKKKHSKGVQKRMQNLVQYNKDKKKKDEDIVIEAEVLNIEDMSIEVPTLTKVEQNIPATIAAVLNQSELKLYVKEVSEWYTSHPDWNAKEDIDDINTIAMEKVIQYRLLLAKKKRPSLDIEKDYSSSAYRVQTARQNLAARRSDRITKGKHGAGGQTNIAIIAGSLDEGKMKMLVSKNDEEASEELNLFPKVE